MHVLLQQNFMSEGGANYEMIHHARGGAYKVDMTALLLQTILLAEGRRRREKEQQHLRLCLLIYHTSLLSLCVCHNLSVRLTHNFTDTLGEK